MQWRGHHDGLSPVILTVMTCIGLLSAGSPVMARTGNSFHGVPLPAPQPVQGVTSQPPGAWLVHNRTAVPATFGSFCYRGTCVDMVAPTMMPHIVEVSLPQNAQPFVVIDIPRARSVRATLSPWRGWPAGEARGLVVHRHRDSGVVMVKLPHLGIVRDDLLAVSVRFPPVTPTTNSRVNGGDAIYFWRINPS